MTDLFPSRESLRYLTCALAIMLIPGIANAQELLVHLQLNGSIENAGTGGTAELVGPAPTTVQGYVGRAMKFDGQVIAVPVDLSSNQVSRLTITAWVKADTNAPDTNHWIVSSGTQGTTPFLRLLKRRQGIKAEIRGGRVSLIAEDFSPAEEWVFVAGTVDIPAQQLRMQQDETRYQRDGVRTDSLYDASKHVNPNDPDADPRAWVFIGARAFDTSLGATIGVAIDEVRVYADVLSSSQLADLKDSAGDIRKVEAPEGIGSGNGIDSGQPPLTTSSPDERRLPDLQEIERRATEVARKEAEARAAEREEAARRQAQLEAEEERQRQEQEDPKTAEHPEEERKSVRGEGRIGVGTLTVEAGELPEGIENLRIASGDEHRTAVSGWSGTAGQLRIDLRRHAIHTIAWYEENDRPCEVVITAYAPGANAYGVATGRSEACDSSGGNTRSRKVVTLQPYGAVITKLRVCFRGPVNPPGLLGPPPDGRVKGLKIMGRGVSADGRLDHTSTSDYAYRPNCERQQNVVACPAGHVATGLVNHMRQTLSNKYYISGLQLICRNVDD